MHRHVHRHNFDINKHFDPNEGQIQSLKYDIKSSWQHELKIEMLRTI